MNVRKQISEKQLDVKIVHHVQTQKTVKDNRPKQNIKIKNKVLPVNRKKRS